MDNVEQSYQDVSKLLVYNDGDFKIKLTFGKRYYDSIEFSLTSCDDSFESEGKAVYEKYVGGFAGSLPTGYECDCSFE